MPNLLRHILLHFTLEFTPGQFQPGGGDAPWSPFVIVKQIQIRSSNGGIIKSVTGPQMAILNKYEFGTMPYFNAVPTNPDETDTAFFSWDILIPFENHTGILPERTVLNTNDFAELGLWITWGDWPDIWQTPPVSAAIVPDKFDITCDVIPLERLPFSDFDKALSRQLMVDSYNSKPITGTNVKFDLFDNTMLKTLMFIISRRVTEGTTPNFLNPYWQPIDHYDPNYASNFNSDWLTRIEVKVNNEIDAYRSFDGFSQLKSVNKSFYSIESLETGVGIIEFDLNHDFSTLFSTIGKNYPLLEFTFSQPPPVIVNGISYDEYKIELFTRQIVTPATVAPVPVIATI